MIGAWAAGAAVAHLMLYRRVPQQAFLVPSVLGAALSAVLGAVLAWQLTGVGMVAAVVFVPFGVAAAITDLQCHRIPNRVTGLCAAALTLVFVGGALIGNWDPAIRALLAGLLAAVILGAASLLFSLGMGDTKLGVSIAALMGWHGWPSLMQALAVTLATACITALILLAGGRARDTHLPFGPFLVAGALTALLIS